VAAEERGMIKMVHPEQTILEELALGEATQESVALTYAFIIRQHGRHANYPCINAAIQKRWKGKTALDCVKRMAWVHVAGMPR
jgi:hypothetical protein